MWTNAKHRRPYLGRAPALAPNQPRINESVRMAMANGRHERPPERSHKLLENNWGMVAFSCAPPFGLAVLRRVFCARSFVGWECVQHRPRGPMDKASAYGAGDCRLESCRGHFTGKKTIRRRYLLKAQHFFHASIFLPFSIFSLLSSDLLPVARVYLPPPSPPSPPCLPRRAVALGTIFCV